MKKKTAEPAPAPAPATDVSVTALTRLDTIFKNASIAWPARIDAAVALLRYGSKEQQADAQAILLTVSGAVEAKDVVRALVEVLRSEYDRANPILTVRG